MFTKTERDRNGEGVGMASTAQIPALQTNMYRVLTQRGKDILWLKMLSFVSIKEAKCYFNMGTNFNMGFKVLRLQTITPWSVGS